LNAFRLCLAVFLAGCATGHGGIPAAVSDVRTVQARTECEETAAHDRDDALKSAWEDGGLASLYLVLRGAASGAWWGAVTSGYAGDGVWIGAAAGAGVGMIIGLAVGIKNGIEAHERYGASYERCVAQALRVTPVEEEQRWEGDSLR
jgi:hypothetical protein